MGTSTGFETKKYILYLLFLAWKSTIVFIEMNTSNYNNIYTFKTTCGDFNTSRNIEIYIRVNFEYPSKFR